MSAQLLKITSNLLQMGRLRRAGRRVPFDVAIASIFFALRAEGVLAVMWEKKGRKRKSAGGYRETWLMALSLGEECDYII